jgi:hypothetical protein
MAKWMKTGASLLLAGACLGITLAAGAVWVHQQSARLDALEQGTAAADTPENAVRSFLNQIKDNDYSGLFAQACHTDPSLDTEASYDAALANHFDGVDPDAVLASETDSTGGFKTYSLYADGQSLGLVKVYEDGGHWLVSMPLSGQESYVVEVPAGTSLQANGTAADPAKMIQSNAAAANFDQISDASVIPLVDVYQLDGLLGYPALCDGSGSAFVLVPDVISGHLLAGTALDDASLNDLIIADAETLASYPAKDVALSAVSAIADPSALWYQRYVTLQNTWFTPHDSSSFSNAQVLSACAQSSDTFTAQVVFDYEAKNTAENLDHTWHIGYQLTFVNRGGSWKICGTEIANELNPDKLAAE